MLIDPQRPQVAEQKFIIWCCYLADFVCLFKSSDNSITVQNICENYTATMKNGLRHNVKWKKQVKDDYTEMTST